MVLLAGIVLALFLIGASIFSSVGVFDSGGSNPDSSKKITNTTAYTSNPISLGFIPKEKLSPIKKYVPGGVNNVSNPSPTASGSANPTPSPTSVPTPTAAPTTTPTSPPSPKPSPTPTPLPAYCQSNTKTADGKPVINIAWVNSNIQAAIDCFKDTSRGGGAVFIPSGTYSIPEKIKLYSNVTLFGDPINRPVIQLQPGKNDSAIGNDTNRGQNNIVTRNIIFKGPGNRGGTCCHGVKLENLNTGYLINVESSNWGLDGFYLGYKSSGGLLKGVDNIRINNCIANNNDRNGISITQGKNNVIDDCSLQNNNLDPEKRASAIDLEPDSGGDTSNNKIINNKLFNNKGNGIGLGPNPNEPPPPGTVLNNAVCYNTTKNNDYAGINGYRNNVFVNNDLQNNDGFERANCGGGNGCASGPESSCQIPNNLSTLPPSPPIPGSVQGVSTKSIFTEVIENIRNFLNSLVTNR